MNTDTGDLFTPDADAEKRYREQVRAVLNGVRLSDSIDMGRLPPVYSELGIADKTLKTNTVAILKALGLKGRNKHHVPEETLENLLDLVHDPKAVFKSLPSADNPNGYVAVLDAQAKDGKPIVAILSPSVDGKGFTFIPSVYERNNFERFVENARNANKVLYVKEKGSELWGRLQSPPRHSSEPHISPELWGRQQSPPRHNSEPGTSILTRNDIVKRFLAKNENILETPAPYGAEKINAREKKKMPDVNGNITEETAVDALISDKNKQEEFYQEFYSLLEKHDINQTGEEIAEREMRTDIVELLTKGKLEVNYSYSRELSGILIKYADAKLELQGDVLTANPALYESEKINDKEKNMSDVNEMSNVNENAPKRPEKKAWKDMTPEDRAITAVTNQRAAVAHALKEGTLACLPGEDGYADTTPAVNIGNGTNFHGATLLQLKAHQKENGFPTAEYITQEDAKKAGVYIKKDEKALFVSFGARNPETGKIEPQNAWLYNAEQTQTPKAVRNWAAKQAETRAESYENSRKEKFGDSYTPREKPGEGPEITCDSTEPEKYIGQYLAAVSMGGKFKVEPEQAAEFKQKFGNSLWEKSVTLENGETRTNPYKLQTICSMAGDHCKQAIKEARTEQRLTQNAHDIENLKQEVHGRGR